MLLEESRYFETRDPFFEVKRQDIFTSNPDQYRLTDHMMFISSKKALINMETHDVVGLVSPHYKVVTNEQLTTIIMEAIMQLGIRITSYLDHLNHSTSKWKRWYILNSDSTIIANPQDTIATHVIVGDAINVMLEVFNSYDAKAAYGCKLLGYRWMSGCGLFTRTENIFKDRFIHCSDNVSEFAATLHLKMEAFKETIAIWKEWTEVEFTFEDLQSFINSRTYVLPRVKKDIIDNYESALEKQYIGSTKWGAFNALCFMAMHMTKSARRNGRISSNIFGNLYKTLERICKDMYNTNMGNVQTGDEALDKLFDDI